MGLKDLVLDPGSRDVKTVPRGSGGHPPRALKNINRAVGFPTIAFPCEMASNLDVETMLAGQFIAKYGSIVVLSDFQGESLFPLLLERLNILHRPAASHDGDGRHLRDQQPGREFSGAGDHQLRPDLLHRFRRDRGQQGARPGC
jgi:CO dehydrogenase/acetyl-CoA synthase gamma subunit (corrinoid Fe-S protein)